MFQAPGQKGLTAFPHIVKSSIKIPCIPGICDISAMRSVFQQLVDFSRWITTRNPPHSPEISFLHTDQKVKAVIIRRCHLPGPVPSAGNSRLLEPVAGRADK